MWEAALLAGYRKLDNLCVIIDDNDSIGVMLNLGDMKAKLEAFGFQVCQIDGHNHSEIERALRIGHVGKPLAIIAHTKRGYGSRTMMEQAMWFHRAPNEEELEVLMKEVDSFETGNV